MSIRWWPLPLIASLSSVNLAGGETVDPAATDRAAATRIGLALLLVRAERDWIHRRMEQLEFVDAKALRWRASVDFFIPNAAPAVSVGREQLRLIPITDLPKGKFPTVNYGDGDISPVWLPLTGKTAEALTSALVYAAFRKLVGIGWKQLPKPLEEELKRIVAPDLDDLRSEPSALLAAGELIDAEEWYYPAMRERLMAEKTLLEVRFSEFGRRRKLRRQWAVWYDTSNRAWERLCRARDGWDSFGTSVQRPARRLMEDVLFRSQVEELARNVVLVAGVTGAPGRRRILELAYEAPFTIRRPGGGLPRIMQYLGWRPWRLDMLIGGRGGSPHLEVVTPAGAEIVEIIAEPLWAEVTDKPVRVPGGTPHVSIPLPEGDDRRYRATITVRISRGGWLTASLLVAAIIAVSMVAGRISIDALFPSSHVADPLIAALEDGTATAVLLALTGVFATLLVGIREHPFVAKLLLPLRSLILVDFGVVLIAAGSLLLHSSTDPAPRILWSVLAGISAAVLALVAISWRLPVIQASRQE
jgi:hypothetical protein